MLVEKVSKGKLTPLEAIEQIKRNAEKVSIVLAGTKNQVPAGYAAVDVKDALAVANNALSIWRGTGSDIHHALTAIEEYERLGGHPSMIRKLRREYDALANPVSL